MTVQLVDHPSFPAEVLRTDQSVLDALARGHVAAAPSSPSMEQFLFGAVPLAVFDDLFLGAHRIDDAVGRWLLHLSGYFGGRWLRGEIASAQPDAPLVAFSVEPTEEAFGVIAARARQAVDACQDPERALAFARTSLLNDETAPDGQAPSPGLTDSFGYNAGYNMEILEAPPEGRSAPPALDVRCTGLLRCTYASPKLSVLSALDETADRLNGDDPAHRELAATLTPLQEAALPRGRAVWSSGLSVQGFGQQAYEQLLEVSSSFLETVQATALTMVRATITRDADLARTGARAEAAMRIWLGAYMTGLLDGEGAIELPRFA